MPLLTLPAGEAGSDYHLYALYNGEEGTTQAGRLHVRTEKTDEYPVTIVAVGDAPIPDEATVKRELDSIFAPYAVEWDVKVEAAPLTDTSWDLDGNGTITAGDEFLSEYSAEQIALHQLFLSTYGKAAGRSVVFLMATPPEELDAGSPARSGDMPIGRKWGYLFGSSINYRTLAHELGHGRMSLSHTFADKHCGDDTKGTTPNLMDYPSAEYPNGTELNLFQWNACHNLAIAGGIFQSDEDGAGQSSDYAQLLRDFIQQKAEELETKGAVKCILHIRSCENDFSVFDTREVVVPEEENSIFRIDGPDFIAYAYFFDVEEIPINPFVPDNSGEIEIQPGLFISLSNGNVINCQNNLTTLDGLLNCNDLDPISPGYFEVLLAKARECIIDDAFSGELATINGFSSFDMADFEAGLQQYLDESAFAGVKLAVRLFGSDGYSKTLLTDGLVSSTEAELTLNYHFDYSSNSLKTSLQVNADYLEEYEASVQDMASNRGNTVNSHALREEMIEYLPQSIHNSVSITEFSSESPFNKAKEVLRFMQVAQLNIKSIWDTGNLHQGTWYPAEQTAYPVYAKVGAIAAGAADAGIEEATELVLFGKMIIEIFSDKAKRESIVQTFTTTEGLESLRESVENEFTEILHDEDKLKYFTSKTTVQVGIFIYTGGLSALAKGGKKALDVIGEIGSLAVGKFDGCPKLLKHIDDLKALKRSGLNALNNVVGISKKFTDPKKLEEIFSRLNEKFSTFIDDLTAKNELVPFFEGDVDFVDSWKKMDDLNADVALRRNKGAIEALSLPHGSRPDPTQYLSQSYINSHLSQFEYDDIVRITSQSMIDEFGGTLGGENAFVTTKTAFDEMMLETGGDLRQIEAKMGFDTGDLGDDAVFAVIKREDVGTFKMSTGNEDGIKSKWIPGGKTSGGMPEATLDLRTVKEYFTPY